MDGKYGTDDIPQIENVDVIGTVDEAAILLVEDMGGVIETPP